MQMQSTFSLQRLGRGEKIYVPGRVNNVAQLPITNEAPLTIEERLDNTALKIVYFPGQYSTEIKCSKDPPRQLKQPPFFHLLVLSAEHQLTVINRGVGGEEPVKRGNITIGVVNLPNRLISLLVVQRASLVLPDIVIALLFTCSVQQAG